LLGPVLIPLWDLTRTGYGGFAKPTLSCFHNTTQLVGFVFGGLGVTLVHAFFQDRKYLNALGWGGGLIGFTYFLKPSFLLAVGPALVGVLCLDYLIRRTNLRAAIWGILCLAIVPLVWTIYGQFVQSAHRPIGFDWDPFLLYFRYSAWRFPSYITNNQFLFIVTTLFLSYAALSIAGLEAVVRKGYRAGTELFQNRSYLWLAVSFVVASFIAFTIVETGVRKTHGNFAWIGHAAYFVVIPAVIALTQHVRHRGVRAVAVTALVLQLVSGAVHLNYFVFKGGLVAKPPSTARLK